MGKSGLQNSSRGLGDSDSDLNPLILAPNNFKHKANSGTTTREHYLTDTVPALQAKAGMTQASFVIMNSHVSARNPNRKSAGKGGSGPLMSKQYSFALDQSPYFVLSGPTNGTSTPVKPTKRILVKRNSLRVTSARSRQTVFQTLTCSLEASPVNLIVWLANAKDSAMSVERSFTRLSESQGLKDPNFYCWKTLKASLAAKGEEPLEPCWKSWGISDIGASGRCLTANSSGFHRIGSACSLSDILEKDVPDKYFLSDAMVKRITESGKLLEPYREEDTVGDCTAT